MGTKTSESMSPAMRTRRSSINSAAWPGACAGCSRMRTSGPSRGSWAVSAGRPVMRPYKASGVSSAISGGRPSATRVFPVRVRQQVLREGRAAGCAVAGRRFAEFGVPERVIPVRVCGDARHHGPAQLTKVVRQAGHLGAGDPGVHEEYAVPALHHHGVVLEQLAPVDQYALGDLLQHGPSRSKTVAAFWPALDR